MYIIIPAYEPDKRLIQGGSRYTINSLKARIIMLMMGVAQAITTT